MKITKHNMPETMYRASHCCKISGNPIAYLILRFLAARLKNTQPNQRSASYKYPGSVIHITPFFAMF